jgi:hypothetical protein
MNRGRVGEERGGKETDGCPLTVWKVARLLVRLKYMTRGSNKPLFVWNAAFHSLPSQMWTLLYPHWMSSLVKKHTPLSQ